MGQSGSLPGCVAGNVLFEMDAFKVGTQTIKSLMSGVYIIQSKKLIVRHLYYTLLSIMLTEGFFVDALHQVEEVLLYSYLSESFCHEWVLNFVMSFLL